MGDDNDLDLDKRKADVAIGPFMENKPYFIQNYLKSWNLGLFASNEYLAKFGTPKEPQDLNNHRIITYGAFCPYSDITWALRVGMPSGCARKPFLEMNSAAEMHKAAEAHLGIVGLSKEYIKLINSNLASVLPDIHGIKVNYYYIYPRQLENSRRVKVLETYLREVYCDGLNLSDLRGEELVQ